MFCPNCGAEIEQDSVFCGNCGNKIQIQKQHESVKKQYDTHEFSQQIPNQTIEVNKSKQKVSGILAVAAVVIIASLIGGTAFVSLKNKSIVEEALENSNTGLMSAHCSFTKGDIDGTPCDYKSPFMEYDISYKYDGNGNLTYAYYHENGREQEWNFESDGSCSTEANEYYTDAHYVYSAKYDSDERIQFYDYVEVDEDDKILHGFRLEYIYDNGNLKKINNYEYDDGEIEDSISGYWEISGSEDRINIATYHEKYGDVSVRINCQYNSMGELESISNYDSNSKLLGKTILAYEYDKECRVIEKNIMNMNYSGSNYYCALYQPIFRNMMTYSVDYAYESAITRFKYAYDENGNIASWGVDYVDIPWGNTYRMDEFLEDDNITTLEFICENQYGPIGGEVKEERDIPTVYDLMLSSDLEGRKGYMQELQDKLEHREFDEVYDVFYNHTIQGTTVYYQNGNIVDQLQDGKALILNFQ